ncbi:YciI family protein [Microbacterium sp. RD1]|uniref:YciI family protein n=1 Tax=Microbacterium sp. RD1 TaxID=3457313 RepID=UPI003FA5765B
MKFLMLVVADPDNDGAETPPLSIEEWGAEVDRRDAWREGDRLQPPTGARTVRRRGGRLLVTDGPFAETHEWIAGFDVLECRDLDEAVGLAAQHPMATHGAIEVRPFWPLT